LACNHAFLPLRPLSEAQRLYIEAYDQPYMLASIASFAGAVNENFRHRQHCDFSETQPSRLPNLSKESEVGNTFNMVET
jgi:hypothetical protein